MKDPHPLPYVTALPKSPHLNIIKDIVENLVLRDAKRWVVIIGVGADVDDAIHVQIEVIKLWNLQ